jgi:glycerone phosphate O-acyltransferase
VDKAGVDKIRALAKKGPLVFMPSHRSYVDFLIVSYMCFCCHLPLPYIAAGEDFLGILLVRYLFRKSGAFFIKRTFLGSMCHLT